MLANLSLKKKILLLTVLPLSAVLLLIGSAAIYNKALSERDLLLNRLTSVRSLLESGDLSFTSIADKHKLEALLDEKVNHAELLQTPTTLFYSTTTNAAGENILPAYSASDKALISEAFKGYETNAVQSGYSSSSFAYATPVIVNHNLVAVLFQDVSFSQSNTRILNYALFVIGAAILGVLMCFLLIYYMADKAVLRNIYKLKSAATEVSRGNLKMPLEITSHDEIGDLARTFEQMRINVSDSRVKLVQTNVVLGDEKARFLASINSLPLGFLLMDRKGEVLMANPSMKLILGARSFVEGVGHDKKVEPETLLSDVLATAKSSVASKKKTSHEIKTEDGKFLRVLTAPVLSDSHGVGGVVVLVEDVTEERILARSKDEFFSIASHELRTPLTAIRGNASMIQMLYAEALKDDDLAQMIGDIHGSSIRLIEIVNDFLDASRLEQQKMDFKRDVFCISEVVESVVYELTATLNEKKLYIKSDKTLNRLPEVVADKNRVKQVIYNLTGNALKFTEKGGLTIGAEVIGDHLHVSVTDTGRGISSENQNLLFHKFQQANDSLFTRDTTRGTGLGLYISRLMVHGMGGKLTLDKSVIGVGSTFSFTLPLASKADMAAKTAHEAAAGIVTK